MSGCPELEAAEKAAEVKAAEAAEAEWAGEWMAADARESSGSSEIDLTETLGWVHDLYNVFCTPVMD